VCGLVYREGSMLPLEGRVAIRMYAFRGMGAMVVCMLAGQGARVVDIEIDTGESVVAGTRDEGADAVAADFGWRVGEEHAASVALAVDTYGLLGHTFRNTALSCGTIAPQTTWWRSISSNGCAVTMLEYPLVCRRVEPDESAALPSLFGRFVKSEAIAAPTQRLRSLAASFMAGHGLCFDGGYLAS